MRNVKIVETITFDNGSVETKSISKWAREFGLGERLVYVRYRNGLRGQTLLAPVQKDILTKEIVHQLWGGHWRYQKNVNEVCEADEEKECIHE